MLRSRGHGRLGLLAVGLGIGAAVASTPGVASGDSSTDWLSSIDQLAGGWSVAAADPAQAMDMQISIGGTLLFPYLDNTAIAMAGPGDIAIAIGDNSYASAQNGVFDFAFADGTNSFAEAEIGNFDVAVADGADSVAKPVSTLNLYRDCSLQRVSTQPWSSVTAAPPSPVSRESTTALAFSTSPPPWATICWRKLSSPPS
jgi:hypothetical protein